MAKQIERVRWRLEFLLDGRAFPLTERLAYIRPFGEKIQLDDLLQRRLRRTADGREYFDMNGRKIFFRPAWPVADERELYHGIVVILREAFMNPPQFFSSEVSVRRGDVVLDVGGNLGTSAMLLAEKVGPRGRVYSFEPVFHELLRTNLRENRVANVQVIPKGVSHTSGVEAFSITDRGIDSRADPIGSRGIRREIEMITLDEFAEQAPLDQVDFIKMDIEGAEEAALRGAERILREFRPKLSLASYHNDVGFDGGDHQHPKLVALVEEHGYRVQEVRHDHIYAW